MARTPIRIDVDDSAFKDFKKLYDGYREELEKMPEGWEAMSKYAQSQYKSQARTMASVMSMNHLFREQDRAERAANNEKAKAQKDEAKRVKEIADTEKRRSQAVKDVWNTTVKTGKAIWDTTQTLFRWVGIAETIGGLAGFGSLFGLTDLANRASDMRKAAASIGTTPAEQEAANIQFQRFSDVNQTLQGIAAAQADMSKWPWLHHLGVSPYEDPGKAFASLLLQANEVWKNPRNRVSQNPEIMALQAAGLSMENIRLAGNTPRWELLQAQKDYIDTAREFAKALDPTTLRTWQQFQVALHEAGVTIEVALLQGLKPLAQVLPDLSKAVADMIKVFLQSPQFKDWMKSLAQGIRDLGSYVGSDDFKNSFQLFLTNIGLVAQKMVDLAVYMNWIPAQAPSYAPPRPTDNSKPPGYDYGRGWVGDDIHGRWVWSPTSPDGQTGRWDYQPPTDNSPAAAAARAGIPGPPKNVGKLGTAAMAALAKSAVDDTTFNHIMDSIFGSHGWIQKSGQRTASEQAWLVAHGALAAAPGHSMHNFGTQARPGARDVVVYGETPQQAAARIRAAGYQFYNLYPEGRHGNQGPHLHIDSELIRSPPHIPPGHLSPSGHIGLTIHVTQPAGTHTAISGNQMKQQ